MVRETGVQSQVESYQRLKKWYMMLLCLTLSIIRYRSRVKWSNPGKGVAPSLATRCSSYWKGSLRVTLDYGCQLYLHWYNFFWYLSLNVLFVCMCISFFVPSSALRKAFELSNFEFPGTKIFRSLLIDAWFYYWSLTPYWSFVREKDTLFPTDQDWFLESAERLF